MNNRITAISKKVDNLKYERNAYQKMLGRQLLNEDTRVDIEEEVELLELQIKYLDKKAKGIYQTLIDYEEDDEMEAYVIVSEDYVNQRLITGATKSYYNKDDDWFFDEMIGATVYLDYDAAKSMLYFIKQLDIFQTADTRVSIEKYVLKEVTQ